MKQYLIKARGYDVAEDAKHPRLVAQLRALVEEEGREDVGFWLPGGSAPSDAQFAHTALLRPEDTLLTLFERGQGLVAATTPEAERLLDGLLEGEYYRSFLISSKAL